jgi:hypothetical protein
MTNKPKLPTFDRSIFTVNHSLNNKIDLLAKNEDFQENHKKLRKILKKTTS